MMLRHILSFLLGAVLSVLTEGCSDTGRDDFADMPNEHRAHLYDFILVGRVLRIRPDPHPRFDYGGDPVAFIAAFKVYCSYKGGRLSPIMNITEVGE